MVTQTLRNMFGTGEPNLVSSQEGANGLVKDMGSRMIVGLDIGTTKVVAVVGQLKGNGLEVIGIGSCPSRGLKKGVVVDIESTVQSIQRAVEEAELMAGCQIHSVYVGIAGSHIRSLNSHGIVAIRDREVNSADLERVHWGHGGLLGQQVLAADHVRLGFDHDGRFPRAVADDAAVDHDPFEGLEC